MRARRADRENLVADSHEQNRIVTDVPKHLRAVGKLGERDAGREVGPARCLLIPTHERSISTSGNGNSNCHSITRSLNGEEHGGHGGGTPIQKLPACAVPKAFRSSE
jgi:hypothetical protein